MVPVGLPGAAQQVDPNLPAGSLDPTFNQTGVAVTEISSFVEARDAASQVVGGVERILVYEPFDSEVWRFTPDGSLDTTFHDDGVAPVPIPASVGGFPTRIATDPRDGSIVVGTWAGSGTGVRIARLHADGSLDTAFAPGGADGDGVRTIVRLATGACGVFPPPVPPPSNDFDRVITFTGFADIGVQSGGQIVVVGPGTDEQAGDQCELVASGAIVAARITDTGVGLSLVATTPPGTQDGVGLRVPKALAVMPDDRIVVTATTRLEDVDIGGERQVTVVRYLASLGLDTGFDGDGSATTSQPERPETVALPVAVQPDGSVAVAVDVPRRPVTSGTIPPEWRLLRWGTGGNFIDQTVATFTDAGDSTAIGGLSTRDGGGFVADGAIPFVGAPDALGVAVYAPSGPGLSGEIQIIEHPGPLVTEISGAALVRLADSSLRVAGRADPDVFGLDNHRQIMLARLDPDGGFDAGFGAAGNGFVQHNGRYGDFDEAVAILPDLRIFASGRIPVTGSRDDPTGYVRRHQENGTLDPTFVRGDLPAPPAVLPGVEITRYAVDDIVTSDVPTLLFGPAWSGGRPVVWSPVATASVAAPAQVTVIQVTSNADAGSGSFRAAIAAANAATEPVDVVFDAGLSITLTSGDVDYTNDQDLTVQGNGSTLTGNGSERILVVSSGAAPALHIDDVTFQGGVAATGTGGGGAVLATGDVEVTDSTFTGNTVAGTAPGDVGGAIHTENADVRVVGSVFSFNSADVGGAIHVQPPGEVEVSGSTFTENSAATSGGGVTAITVRVVDGSSFQENVAGSGGAISGGTVTVTDSELVGNLAIGAGGGAIDASQVDANGALFADNSAETDGGAVITTGPVTITGSTFQRNQGGGGFSTGGAVNANGSVHVTGSTFEDNGGVHTGGGIYVEGSAGVADAVVVESSTFRGNLAAFNGGAIYAQGVPGERPSGVVIASTFTGNHADSGDGGAVRVAGDITVEDSLFESGVADHGGAIYADVVTATDSVFRTNTAEFLGGALHATEGADITTSTFSGNDVEDVEGLGGAIYTFADVDVTLDSSTFAGNSAALGGAVYTDWDMRAVNSTFAENAAGDGGAIWAATQVFLTYTTIADNAGSSQLLVEDGPATGAALETFGSVITNPEGGENCSVIGTSSTYSYDTDGTCGFVGEGDTSGGLDPFLGALADNGGPTQTMLPPSRSPVVSAIPNGVCTAVGIDVDQRGQPRPQGVLCDIGAVEVVGQGIDIAVDGMVVDSGGRVVIAGAASSGASRIGAVHRLLPNGGPDLAFNGGFPVLFELDCCGTAFHDVVVDAQGRIVAVGETRHVNGNREDTLIAVRLLADGSLDPAFGSGGIVRLEQSSVRDEASASAVALDGDGRIVITGFGSELPCSECTGFVRRLLVARLLGNGSRDASFGSDPNFGDGVVVVGPEDYALVVDPTSELEGADVAVDGARIAVVGNLDAVVCGAACVSSQRGFVAQFTPNGAPDTSFGAQGNGLAFPFAGVSEANGVAVDSIGQIVVAGGDSTAAGGAFAVARLGTDGQNDPAFGDAGTVTTPVGVVGSAAATDVAIASDGKIVVTGYATDDRGTRAVTARYLPGAALQCGPSPLDLGSVVLDTPPSSGVVRCTNTGPSRLIITSITVSGANPSDFVPNTVPCLVTLEPGEFCELSVTFTPSAAGARVATLSLAFSGQGTTGPTLVSLRGTGIARDSTLSFDPASLTFAEQLGLTTSPAQTVTVTNVGNIPVTISTVVIENDPAGDFAIAPSSTCAGATLLPGARCQVLVTFTPRAPGARAATLRFDDTGTGAPHRLPLRGTGATPVLVANPGVGPPGSATVVAGSDFPPGFVALAWAEPGALEPGRFPEPAVAVGANEDGAFTSSVLVFPKSRTGGRVLLAVAGDFRGQTAFLVVPRTVQAPTFIGRG